MNERERKGLRGSGITRAATVAAVLLLVLSLLILVGVPAYLSTAQARTQVARILSEYLQEKVSIAGLCSSGTTIYVKGASLANPAGFSGDLARAETIVIAPNWGDLLAGRRNFRIVSVDGITLDLLKNREGEWNFTHLQRVLAAKKPSGKETFIARFVLGNGTVRLRGEEWRGISLKIFNFTANGSQVSPLEFSGEDAGGNRYRVVGKVRPGKEPVVDVTLTASNLALAQIAKEARLKDTRLLEGARGKLDVRCTFRRGAAGLNGTMYFSGVQGTSRHEFAGKVTTSLQYDMHEDLLRILPTTVSINRVADIHASGTVTGVKKERRYDIELGTGEMALASLTELVPNLERKQIAVTGTAQLPSVRLRGSAKGGMPDATGRLTLADVSMQRRGETVFAGADAGIDFSRDAKGVSGRGRVTQRESGIPGMVQHAGADFTFTLTEKLRPVRAEVSGLHATVLGIALAGRLNFDATRHDRLTARLQAPATPASTLNPWLKRYETRLDGGSITALVDASGATFQQLHLVGSAHLSGIVGSKGNSRFSLRQAALSTDISRGQGATVATGTAHLEDAAFAGKRGSADFSFGYRDRRLAIDRLRGSYAGTSLVAEHLEAELAPRSGARLPIVLGASQCDLRRGNIAVTGLSGSMRGGYTSEPGGRWLDGRLVLSAGSFSWQGKTIQRPRADVLFTREGARGNINGAAYGGTVAATITYDPFNPRSDTGFNLSLRTVSLPQLYAMTGKGKGMVPSAGVVDATIAGTYRRGSGLSCTFQGVGKDVALTARGKTVFSRVALELRGALDPKRLSLSQATAILEGGARLEVKGELQDPLTPGRKGVISLLIPETGINTIIDPLTNALPRFLQEGKAAGSVAGAGSMTVGGGHALLAANVSFKNAGLEVPSQKLVVAGLDGTIPISLDLSGGTTFQRSGGLSYSRANFPKLLRELRTKAATGSPSLTAERIGFGTLETGMISLQLQSREGITEVSSLKTTFYGGTIVGAGAVSFQQGVKFRSDLLVDSLSLKELCGAMPAIKGYISGKVDGILSIAEVGRGAEGMMGFVDLWAHAGGGEKMLVSREFLQRLSKRKIGGFFFSSDRPYDNAEIKATLEGGLLSFEALTIKHTNFFGVRDLQVSIAPTQNRIELANLFSSIKEAASRSKAKAGKAQEAPAQAPATEFKWAE